MKIVMDVRQEARRSVAIGVEGVLRVLGHEVFLWKDDSKPAFDIFDEVEPELFISSTDNDKAISKCLEERKDLQIFPLNKIDYAADTISFSHGQIKKKYYSDVCYVGDHLSGFPEHIMAVLGVVLKLRICGDKPWPIKQYLGPISLETLPDFYASSLVCLDFEGKEKPYEILMSASYPVTIQSSDDITKIYDMTNPNNASLRFQKILQGREYIRLGHTYWHRIASMWEILDRKEEVKRTMEVYNDTVQI